MKHGNQMFLVVAAILLLAAGNGVQAQQYYWSNLAGAVGGNGSVDGNSIVARFNNPTSVAMDSSGNVYVADSANNTIRKITTAGVVSTLAGTPGVTGSANGTGSAAQFSYPTGIAADGSGNVYVADSGNYTIRKVTSSGVVTTLAGSAGVYGNNDGMGSGATFGYFSGIAADSGDNIYVADTYNHTIRKVATGGVVTTIAGTAGQVGIADGTGNAAQFNTPTSIAIDSGNNLYIADTYNHSIRKVTSSGVVTTLAGNSGLFGTMDGIGAGALFYYPSGIAVDASGNVYVSDTGNYTIRKVTATGVVSTIAGTVGAYGMTNGIGTGAQFRMPVGIVVDSGGNNLFIADAANEAIRNISYGVVTTYAGGGLLFGGGDGTGSGAHFNVPGAIAADTSGNLYVANTNYHSIRKVTATGVVTTIAGTYGSSGSADGTGTAALFNYPGGITVDSSGNVYVADTYNHTIRKVTSAGVVTTIAGTVGLQGSTNATGTAATFSNPTGVAADSSGNVYVADTYNHTIRKVTSAGVVTTIAGTTNVAGYTDGTGTSALFNYPNGMAIDSTGSLYIADSGNFTIRKLTLSGGNWVSSTIAGGAGASGYLDATGTAARFGNPTALSVDSIGNIYVTDSASNTIRMITPAGVVTTIGGMANVSGGADGIGTMAQLFAPTGIAVTTAGLYVADSGNNRIAVGSIAGTQAATSIAATSVTLNGQVYPGGIATTVSFQYGTTTAYGSTTTAQSAGSGTSFTAANANLTGLSANTAYHYRLVATNANGTFYGTDQTFATPPAAAPTINNTSISIGIVGIAYSTQISASNSPTAYGATNLFGGLSVNPLTGVISGTPTTAGSASVTLTASNAVGTGTKTLTLTVSPLATPVITSGTAASGVVGSPFNYTIVGTNYSTAYSATGLPSGWTINTASGAITGTATVSGSFAITIGATNLSGTTTSTLTISNIPTYSWGCLAGISLSPGANDGNAGVTGAFFHYPSNTAVDSVGDVYVVDSSNNTIRKVSPTGVVTTLAGNPGVSGTADGTGSTALFKNPDGIAIDSVGNLYIADGGNYSVRKVTPAGVVTTIAGLAGTSGTADGTGSAARFIYPTSITIDTTGTLYVTDPNCVRKITPVGVVTTIAGTPGTSGSTDGTGSAALFSGLDGITIDSSGNLYVVDTFNETVRKLTYSAGAWTSSIIAGSTGAYGSTDGSGSAARFYLPFGITADNSGNLYIADTYNNTIRKLTCSSGTWTSTTLAGSAGIIGTADGTGSAARFYNPYGMSADSNGNLYVADHSNNTIRKITPAGVVTTLAGTPKSAGSADGYGIPPLFNNPGSATVDSSGNLYIADTNNSTIRKVAIDGTVTTIAGTSNVTGSTDGTGAAALFNSPNGIGIDNTGNLYIADKGNFTIRKLICSTSTGLWTSTTLAGSPGISGSSDGTGSAARFIAPQGGMAVDSANNVYLTDSGNYTIRKITPTGVVTTFAGSAGAPGSTDGTGTAARFYSPTGLTIDATGNLYVSDFSNHTIRKITPAGVVTTIAGSPGIAGVTDGIGTAAHFNCPNGITADTSGNLYVTDSTNSIIRKIVPNGSSWMVTTIAGYNGINSIYGKGSSIYYAMTGIVAGANGNIYITNGTYDFIGIGAPVTIPTITSSLALTATTGSAFSYTIQGANPPNTFAKLNANSLPTGYSATGLPAGLSLNSLTGLITGTPVVSGIFSSILSVTNLAGTGNATLNITIPTLYQIWQSQNFTSAQLADSSISGDTATPARDGVTNLMKYALSLAPFAYAADGLPTTGTTNVNGTNYLTISYTMATARTDITYTVQVSSDLQTWNSGPGYTTITNATDNLDGTQTILARDLTPISSSTSKRFIRLIVSKP